MKISAESFHTAPTPPVLHPCCLMSSTPQHLLTRCTLSLLPHYPLRSGCSPISVCPQFGILPPKVVPVARTKQIMPRKERKELKKKQAKGFHTSAACLTAFQPSCNSGCDDTRSSGEPITALSQAVFGATPPQDPNADNRFESESESASALLLDTGHLSFGWGTGQAAAFAGVNSNGKASCTSAARGLAEHGSGDLASALSRMLLDGPGTAEQQAQSSAAALPPAAASSPIRTVLASHLRILGPSACSMIGLPEGTEGSRDTR